MKSVFNNVWFKCITVLLIITVSAGAIISILHNVFNVSEQERLARAVKAVYGKEVNATPVDIPDWYSSEYGSIEKIYAFTDEGKDFKLFYSVGNYGYHNGTVSLWVLVGYEDGNFTGILKTQMADSSKQTLMSQLSDNFYSAYAQLKAEDILDGKTFGDKDTDHTVKNIVTGATGSSTASNNSVNAVFDYLREEATHNAKD